MDFKPGEIAQWIVGLPGPDMDECVVVGKNDDGTYAVTFQVYGTGPWHIDKAFPGERRIGGLFKKTTPLVEATFIEKDGRFLPAIKRGDKVSRYNSIPRSFGSEGEAFSHAERQAIELNKPEMARRRQAEKQAAAVHMKAMKASDPA